MNRQEHTFLLHERWWVMNETKTETRYRLHNFVLNAFLTSRGTWTFREEDARLFRTRKDADDRRKRHYSTDIDIERISF